MHQAAHNAFTEAFGALPDIPDFPGVHATAPGTANVSYGPIAADMQPDPSALLQPSTMWWDLENLPTDLQTLVSSTLTAAGYSAYDPQSQHNPSLGDFDGDMSFLGLQ